MRMLTAAALVVASLAMAGCQSTGGGPGPALVDYCKQYGFGRPGDANFEQCLIDNSLSGRGEQLDKRAVGANGT